MTVGGTGGGAEPGGRGGNREDGALQPPPVVVQMPDPKWWQTFATPITVVAIAVLGFLWGAVQEGDANVAREVTALRTTVEKLDARITHLEQLRMSAAQRDPPPRGDVGSTGD